MLSSSLSHLGTDRGRIRPPAPLYSDAVAIEEHEPHTLTLTVLMTPALRRPRSTTATPGIERRSSAWSRVWFASILSPPTAEILYGMSIVRA